MDRNLNHRLLKRVSGDISLAPVKFDRDRPLSSGVPLRRCNKEISISSCCEHQQSSPTTRHLISGQTNPTLKNRKSHQQNHAKPGSDASFQTLETKCLVENYGSEYDEWKKSTLFSLLPKTGDFYMVPTNTAVTSVETKSKSTLSTEVCTCEGKENPYIACSLEYPPSITPLNTQSQSFFDKIGKVHNHGTINSALESRQQRSSISCIKTLTNAISTTSADKQTEIESTPVEEILITTATSLELPVSSRNLLQTRSEEWSLINEMGTAYSSECKVAPTWEIEKKTATKSSKTSQCSALPCTYFGDGDKISSQTGTGQISDANTNNNTIVPPVPPTSPAVSLPDKPSFMFTFKKPKPRQRPRSIVTNSSSNKASLPSTASTPAPFSPITDALRMKPKLPNRWVMDIEEHTSVNNNNNNVNIQKSTKNKLSDSNANIVTDLSKQLSTSAKISNIPLSRNESSAHEKVVVEVLPVNITNQSTDFNPSSTNAVVGSNYSTTTRAADTGTATTELQRESTVFEPDASFWHSDSTPSTEKANKRTESNLKPDHNIRKRQSHHANVNQKAVKSVKAAKKLSEPNIVSVTETDTTSHKTETTSKTSGIPTDEKTGSSGSQETATSSAQHEQSVATYPYPGYTYNDINNYPSQGSSESAGPFLRTEKGAIRFHLPGRIQHKTTIKVAHFPTGDDKNIILNVKPDKEEDECVEVPPPYCANNQNFIMPSSTECPPYPFNPYGYGGCSPYSAANYYGYYGYPPYY